MARTLNALNKGFKTYLQMKGEIVGIKFHESIDRYVSHKFKEHKYPMYYCYMVKLASKGKAVKTSHKGIACETAPKIMGLEAYYDDETGPDGWDAIKIYNNFNLAKSKHNSLKPKNRSVGVSVGPLGDFIDKPDTLIFVVTPYQMMRIMQGYHYFNTEELSIKMSGQCGVCYESTMYPYETQKMNISALCSGTRFMCQWPEDVLMVSLPFMMAEEVLEGLIKTANPCELDYKKDQIMHEDNQHTLKKKSNYFKT